MRHTRKSKQTNLISPGAMLVAAFLALTLWFSSAANSADALDISLDGDLVTIDAEQTGLRIILQQLSLRGDFDLWISGALPESVVSIHIEKQPMEVALKRLLADTSYTLVFDDNGEKVTGLHVLPTGVEQSVLVDSKNVKFPDSAQTLQQALQPLAIPDDVKAAMVNQINNNQQADREDLTRQHNDNLSIVLDKIEEFGNPESETMRQLREAMQQRNMNALQADILNSLNGGVTSTMPKTPGEPGAAEVEILRQLRESLGQYLTGSENPVQAEPNQ